MLIGGDRQCRAATCFMEGSEFQGGGLAEQVYRGHTHCSLSSVRRVILAFRPLSPSVARETAAC
jgi:hypothetical protein